MLLSTFEEKYELKNVTNQVIYFIKFIYLDYFNLIN